MRQQIHNPFAAHKFEGSILTIGGIKIQILKATYSFQVILKYVCLKLSGSLPAVSLTTSKFRIAASFVFSATMNCSQLFERLSRFTSDV